MLDTICVKNAGATQKLVWIGVFMCAKFVSFACSSNPKKPKKNKKVFFINKN
jgi:hypothetical protein